MLDQSLPLAFGETHQAGGLRRWSGAGDGQKWAVRKRGRRHAIAYLGDHQELWASGYELQERPDLLTDFARLGDIALNAGADLCPDRTWWEWVLAAAKVPNVQLAAIDFVRRYGPPWNNDAPPKLVRRRLAGFGHFFTGQFDPERPPSGRRRGATDWYEIAACPPRRRLPDGSWPGPSYLGEFFIDVLLAESAQIAGAIRLRELGDTDPSLMALLTLEGMLSWRLNTDFSHGIKLVNPRGERVGAAWESSTTAKDLHWELVLLARDLIGAAWIRFSESLNAAAWRTCKDPVCGRVFPTSHRNQLFHSDDCRNRYKQREFRRKRREAKS